MEISTAGVICFGFFALQNMGVGSFEKNQFSNVRNCTSAPGQLCHEDKHHLSDEIESSLVVFCMYGPQSVVHFGWALTVDCCPVLFPILMSSIKFTLLSTSAKGNFCSMLLPKFWNKHSRRYFGSQAGLVQNCGSCCNGKELWQKVCDRDLVVKKHASAIDEKVEKPHS